MYRLMIVDDEKMVINSLVFGFDWQKAGFVVVATATSAKEALLLCEKLNPDVILTDIKMPGMTGLDLMKACQNQVSPPKFVVISGHADFEYAKGALKLGAVAYCLKPLEEEEILDALDTVQKAIIENQDLKAMHLKAFLDTPNKDTVSRVLSHMHISGAVGVALSIGDMQDIFKGHIQALSFHISENTYLYFFPKDPQNLEDYAFKSALLGAVTSGKIKAFTYDITEDICTYLLTSWHLLSNSLYVSFFSEDRVAIGKRTEEKLNTAFLKDEVTPLLNANRPKEVHKLLTTFLEEKTVIFTMQEALTMYNLLSALMTRLLNTPPQRSLRYGYELRHLFSNFDEMLQFFIRRLGHVYQKVGDIQTVQNETLKNILLDIGHTFTQNISFQEVCEAHAISPSYLSQLFKKEMQTTFTNYLNDLRIDYAKELLENTSTLVVQVSEQAGYDNYLNFTKLFKKKTGMTPKQYRTFCIQNVDSF